MIPGLDPDLESDFQPFSDSLPNPDSAKSGIVTPLLFICLFSFTEGDTAALRESLAQLSGASSPAESVVSTTSSNPSSSVSQRGGGGNRPDILFLKHASSIFRQSSNPVCGFSMTEQVWLCAVWPIENWLASSLKQIQGWTTV